jgi:phage shock protein PspC (stress-responsive transcriptional regulator)
MNNNLHRSVKNKILGGVCGGLGEFFRVDPTVVRIIFILITIFAGSGIFIYLLLWLLIPSQKNIGVISEDTIKESFEEMKDRASTFAHDISHSTNHKSNRSLWAVLIILLGFFFLLQNLGIISAFSMDHTWPILLIILGLFIIYK